MEIPGVDDNILCTKFPTTNYNIGCDSAGAYYEECKTDLYTSLTPDGTNYTRSLLFKINNIETPITMVCTSATPQNIPTNISECFVEITS
jgi:hypothetical protein